MNFMNQVNGMRRLQLLLIGTSIIAALQTSRLQAENSQPDRKLIYKTVNDTELQLHVFDPPGLKPTDQRPAIVFFFGGGWNGGDPKQFYQQARIMADQGIVAFSAEYRVKSRNKTTPFECVKDGKSAIRWVRENAADLGVDPTRIIASGGSAGGHVAACSGVIEGNEEAGEELDIPSTPNAMILFNPVIDTTEKGYGVRSVGKNRKTEISPCHHVRKGIPPTIIFHGTGDKTVPFENVQRFTRLMQNAGNTCVLVSFEGKGHGFFNGAFFRSSNTDTDFDLTMDKSLEFLKGLNLIDEEK